MKSVTSRLIAILVLVLGFAPAYAERQTLAVQMADAYAFTLDQKANTTAEHLSPGTVTAVVMAADPVNMVFNFITVSEGDGRREARQFVRNLNSDNKVVRRKTSDRDSCWIAAFGQQGGSVTNVYVPEGGCNI